jgi:hypothetical protein
MVRQRIIWKLYLQNLVVHDGDRKVAPSWRPRHLHRAIVKVTGPTEPEGHNSRLN